MSLIHYWPCEMDTEDIKGNGNPLGTWEYQHDRGCCEPHTVTLPETLTSDYTISYDLFRETFPSGRNDWAMDFGTTPQSWAYSPNEYQHGIIVWYLRGSSLGLTIQSQNMAQFKLPDSITANRWVHTEIHRKGRNHYTIFIDHQEVIDIVSETQYNLKEFYFFNHGGGGSLKHSGYISNLRVYDSYNVESLQPPNYLYEHQYEIYAITKEE